MSMAAYPKQNKENFSKNLMTIETVDKTKEFEKYIGTDLCVWGEDSRKVGNGNQCDVDLK